MKGRLFRENKDRLPPRTNLKRGRETRFLLPWGVLESNEHLFQLEE